MVVLCRTNLFSNYIAVEILGPRILIFAWWYIGVIFECLYNKDLQVLGPGVKVGWPLLGNGFKLF